MWCQLICLYIYISVVMLFYLCNPLVDNLEWKAMQHVTLEKVRIGQINLRVSDCGVVDHVFKSGSTYSAKPFDRKPPQL